MRTRVKICCIQNVQEAGLAVRYGADAIGLVSEMPSGPGVISENEIAEIAATVPPPVTVFLLTSKRSAEQIIVQQKRCRVSAIQIVDLPEPGTYVRLREALPGISVVQVIHMTGEEALEKAIELAPSVDALLLDSAKVTSAGRQLGGTGETHDWRLSRKIRDSVNVPVFLAGGLNAGNVAEAIRVARPFAVDVCSGVRTNGRLDERKVSGFFESVAEVDRSPR